MKKSNIPFPTAHNSEPVSGLGVSSSPSGIFKNSIRTNECIFPQKTKKTKVGKDIINSKNKK